MSVMDGTASAAAMGMGGSKLSSTLAKLDRKWQVTSRTSKQPTGGNAGWTKLVLYTDEEREELEELDRLAAQTAAAHAASAHATYEATYTATGPGAVGIGPGMDGATSSANSDGFTLSSTYQQQQNEFTQRQIKLDRDQTPQNRDNRNGYNHHHEHLHYQNLPHEQLQYQQQQQQQHYEQQQYEQQQYEQQQHLQQQQQQQPKRTKKSPSKRHVGAQEEEFVYLLEPSTAPSMVLFFLGGAGLGQYPHIAYSEYLTRISERLNAAIITAPYPLSLDHFELSKKAGELMRRAIVQCEDRGVGYSMDLPKFYLGHSLGSKLMAIQLAASGIRDIDGVGLMGYNNFGFSNTIDMIKGFADGMDYRESVSRESVDVGVGPNINGRNKPHAGFNFAGVKVGARSARGRNGVGPRPGSGANNRNSNGPGIDGVGANVGGQSVPGFDLDQILDFAGQAVGMMGYEFSPNPNSMEHIVEMKYDEALQEKTRLFVYRKDELDSSRDFYNACCRGIERQKTLERKQQPDIYQQQGTHHTVVTGHASAPASPMTVSMMDGNHLSPVHLELGADDFASHARGDFESVSFGNAQETNLAVNAVCDWILQR